MSADALPPPPFAGFRPAALTVLRGLAANQDKGWMAANRHRYEAEVRAPFMSLVADLSDRLAAIGLPLGGNPQRAVFRPNRDVRFSADKSPYKTHAGALLTRGGDKQAPGVLYIQLDPKGSFVGIGFFRPEPPALSRLRDGLIRHPHRWADIVQTLAAEGLPLDREGALVNLPRGFSDVPPAVEQDIRLKSWIVQRALTPAMIRRPALVDHLLDLACSSEKLLRFGWAALEQR